MAPQAVRVEAIVARSRRERRVGSFLRRRKVMRVRGMRVARVASPAEVGAAHPCRRRRAISGASGVVGVAFEAMKPGSWSVSMRRLVETVPLAGRVRVVWPQAQVV